jgi:hypothetical protein
MRTKWIVLLLALAGALLIFVVVGLAQNASTNAPAINAIAVNHAANTTNANSDSLPNANANTLSNTNATADWERYVSTDFGFSFRYPPTWAATRQDGTGSFYVYPKSGIQEPVKLIEAVRGSTEDALAWMNRDRTGSARFQLTQDSITIDGRIAPLALDGQSPIRYAVVALSSYTLVVWIFPPLEQDTYETIVGTIAD